MKGLIAKVNAEAAAIRTTAEANLFKAQQEASGVQALLDSQAIGLGNLVNAAKGISSIHISFLTRFLLI